jgi:predicted DNA-binding transcriptional regulator YafY
LRALRQVGLEAFAPATESVLAKLGRVLPESLRESLRTVEDVVSMEPSPWVAPASVKCLIGAATAIRNNRRVRFDYRSHDETNSRREIEPYAVLHSDGRWYLIGHCLSRGALRTFRLDRAEHLEVGTETFEAAVGFDARRYLAEHMPFVQTEYQIEVWIDMPVEEAARQFVLWRVVVETDGSGTRLRCGRDRLELFAAVLLSLGRRIVVHGPEELRETFRGLAEQATRAAESS